MLILFCIVLFAFFFCFAVAALVGEHGEELELWCSDREDEAKFLSMFKENPEMM